MKKGKKSKKEKKARMAESKKAKGPSRLAIPDCKHFTGYKPCFPGSECLDGCERPNPRGKRILIVNLEAMGNVLVTTSMLPELKRKYKESSISWLTLANAAPLLRHNPHLDEVLVWNQESLVRLQSRRFDLVLSIDKAQAPCALVMALAADEKRGYGLDGDGVIVPLNKEAEYNYILGLNDELKFHVNQKANTQLLTEAMGLKFRRDEYILNLSPEEEAFCADYRRAQIDGGGATGARNGGSHDGRGGDGALVVGFNTGCSNLYANKKMTLDQHEVLIRDLARDPGLKLVLVGGPEDTERNAELVRRVGPLVHSTPTTEGVRRGLCYINVCDVIISGDSFGLHASIGLKKQIICWFGLTCPQEIDLFERGVKLIPHGLACAPCWKRECPYNLECIQMIDLDAIAAEVRKLAAGATS
jgi:heptosyltransferase-2